MPCWIGTKSGFANITSNIKVTSAHIKVEIQKIDDIDSPSHNGNINGSAPSAGNKFGVEERRENIQAQPVHVDTTQSKIVKHPKTKQ